MSICVKCGKKEGINRIPSLEQKACDECFARMIERRFNKEMREHYPKLKKITIKIEKPSDKVLYYLLSERVKGNPSMSVKKSESNNVAKQTLDDNAIAILISFLAGKGSPKIKSSPLGNTSEEELATYARIKGIKFSGNKHKEKEITKILAELERIKPGVMYSIKRFSDKLHV